MSDDLAATIKAHQSCIWPRGMCACEKRHSVTDRHIAMLDELYKADVLRKAEWLRARRRITDA